MASLGTTVDHMKLTLGLWGTTRGRTCLNNLKWCHGVSVCSYILEQESVITFVLATSIIGISMKLCYYVSL